MSLGLVVALPEEARAAGRALSGGRPSCAGPCRHGKSPVHQVCGTAGGEAVQIAWAGAGQTAASRAAETLLQAGARSLLAVGFSGSLAPQVRPCDLLLAAQILDEEGTRWSADAGLLEALTATVSTAHSSRRALSFHQGTLVTVSRVITTTREKYRLGEETGALAVDMESAAVARCAAEARVPMAALRAVTDGLDEPLPLDFNRCIDSEGQFHYMRLLLLLARRPFALRGLIRLGRHSARAGQALASFLALALPLIAGTQLSVVNSP